MRVLLAGATGAIGRELVPRLIAVETAEGEIKSIGSVVNPEKLAHLGEATNLGSLLKGRRSDRMGARLQLTR